MSEPTGIIRCANLGEPRYASPLPGLRAKIGAASRFIDPHRYVAYAIEQIGDRTIVPFSFMSGPIGPNQIACHVLHSNARAHDLVRAHIGQSPLYNGQIAGIGPRYCPSFEDKVMRFPDRERHQIFLEPEGLDVDEIYVNGFSMSLPPSEPSPARV